jgi:hypothetical protein
MVWVKQADTECAEVVRRLMFRGGSRLIVGERVGQCSDLRDERYVFERYLANLLTARWGVIYGQPANTGPDVVIPFHTFIFIYWQIEEKLSKLCHR